MKNKWIALFMKAVCFFITCIFIGCSMIQPINDTKNTTAQKDTTFRPIRTTASFEEAGKWWGTKHWNSHLKPNDIDEFFVGALIDNNNLDFFWIHTDLKSAFVKGYRFGYQDRTADLVLGPQLTEAAARIGLSTAKKFVSVINIFERDWAETLQRAIHVFITLIVEGSQADRENFIQKFTGVYALKYNDTQEKLRAGGFISQVSEGGTLLYIDATKTLALLDIPKPATLKAEIYSQTFKVMGDELGKRFSHNLIKRDELIDLLRRSKTALQEVPESIPSLTMRLEKNMGIIYDAFLKSYGTDADNVFKGLIKDAGYEVTLKNIELKIKPIVLPGDNAQEKQTQFESITIETPKPNLPASKKKR